MRFTGLDFFPDGRIAVCSWDGDVWLVDLLPPSTQTEQPNPQTLRWQRIASGLFQPLGLKIVDGQIHVTCRDQLAVLHDLNGDGETDFYECFNNDHQVTEHFHEFAMGLQTDADGNFYYAKSGRHALARGRAASRHAAASAARTARAPTSWPPASAPPTASASTPTARSSSPIRKGSGSPRTASTGSRSIRRASRFYGNMFGYHDVTDPSDSAMEPPLCWITNAFDRSPAELLWVDSKRWGPLNGSLLNLSYGYGKSSSCRTKT